MSRATSSARTRRNERRQRRRRARRAGYNLGNLSDGIFLFIPQATDIAGNLISANRAAGIHAATQQTGTTPGSTVTGTLSIQGNYIGTDISGTLTNQPNTNPAVPLGNGSDGVFLDNLKPSSPVGLAAEISQNVVSGNRANGIDVLDSSNVSIVGNKIGTDRTGVVNLGNSSNGIFLNGSSHITIDGTGTAGPNIISDNLGSGVFISGGTQFPRGP